PFLNNEAYFKGAKPKRPSSPELGPLLRAICWNIERGIHFDQIRIALSEPEKFDQVLAEKKDPKTKPLTSDQLKVVKQQLDVLQPADEIGRASCRERDYSSEVDGAARRKM